MPDDANEPTRLLAELRARVESAAQQMADLTTELAMRRSATDDLESLVDILLGLGDTAVVVIDEERRIQGVSRAAAERFEGAAVGKPLSSVLPGETFDRVAARVDVQHPRDGGGQFEAGDVLVHPLPGGGAVLVLAGR
jgi:hypothetical protein